MQVNVELDGELHEVERVYYDKDDMSIHIVASHDTIPEPRYTPLWHIKQGVRRWVISTTPTWPEDYSTVRTERTCTA